MKTSSFSIIAALLIAGVAEAGVEVRNFSITALSDGTYHYSYRIRLVSGRLDPSSGIPQIVTIYDIPGLIPGSLEVSAPWGGNVQYTGSDATDIPRSSADDPTLLNITLKYTGSSVTYAPADVGTVAFRVPAGTSGPIVYIGQSTSPYRGGVGLIGRVSGPAR